MSSSFNTSGLSGLRLHIRNLELLKRTASVSDICIFFTFRGFLGVDSSLGNWRLGESQFFSKIVVTRKSSRNGE